MKTNHHTSNFRTPTDDATTAAHNAGRAAYHAGEGWEQFPPKSHARAGWAAAATETAEEAHCTRTAAPASNSSLITHNS